ncbi:MAG: hypothetical protein Fur002_10870 [Anaerolineales bacterium]
MPPRFSIQIDLCAGTPLHAQIMQHIQQRLREGELTPGDKLPTVRELAAELGVNFNTVARAYRALDREGALSTQQGRGTFAVKIPAAKHTAARQKAALAALAKKYARGVAALRATPEDALAAVQAELLQRERGVPRETFRRFP